MKKLTNRGVNEALIDNTVAETEQLQRKVFWADMGKRKMKFEILGLK